MLAAPSVSGSHTRTDGEDAVKVGVVGKGGVGKTTTAALLAGAFARRGHRVVAIDTDSNPNLGTSLGLSFAEVDAVPVLPRAIVVGVGGDRTVDEVMAEFGRATPVGPVLLSAIRVGEAGAGCTCSGHATVRSLLGAALDEHADVTVIDMEAGLEHLSRSGGTLAYADVLLVVIEPSRKAVITAARTQALAEELGIPRVLCIGNKARDERDVDFLREATAEHGLELLAVLPHDAGVRDADRTGDAVAAVPPAALDAVIDEVADALGAPAAL
jgi:CO dehydrogenase maturation factor